MLKITRQNFFRNITNKESWKWHKRKSKNQTSWRHDRLKQMKKYDAVKGLPPPIEVEERIKEESPYHRKKAPSYIKILTED